MVILLLESYGSKKNNRRQYDILVPLETPFGMITWAAPKTCWQAAPNCPVSHKITTPKISARPYGPHLSATNFGLALWASPFASLGTFPRKHNPTVSSVLQASPFERHKCPGPHFFACSMSVSHCFFSQHAVALDLTDLFVVNVLAHTYAPLYDLFAL